MMIKFITIGKLNSHDLLYANFNTSFVPASGKLSFNKNQISHDKEESKKWDENFLMTLEFENLCKSGCKSHVTKVSALCEQCQASLGDEKKKWFQIISVFENHQTNRSLIRLDKMVE